MSLRSSSYCSTYGIFTEIRQACPFLLPHGMIARTTLPTPSGPLESGIAVGSNPGIQSGWFRHRDAEQTGSHGVVEVGCRKSQHANTGQTIAEEVIQPLSWMRKLL